jgi:hypothetical protein
MSKRLRGAQGGRPAGSKRLEMDPEAAELLDEAKKELKAAKARETRAVKAATREANNAANLAERAAELASIPRVAPIPSSAEMAEEAEILDDIAAARGEPEDMYPAVQAALNAQRAAGMERLAEAEESLASGGRRQKGKKYIPLDEAIRRENALRSAMAGGAQPLSPFGKPLRFGGAAVGPRGTALPQIQELALSPQNINEITSNIRMLNDVDLSDLRGRYKNAASFEQATREYLGSIEGYRWFQGQAAQWRQRVAAAGKPGSTGRLVQQILRQTCLPEADGMVRYKDRYENTQTTMDKIKTTVNYSWVLQPAVPRQLLNPADGMVVLFPDTPLHGVTFYDPNNNSMIKTGTWKGPNEDGEAIQSPLTQATGDGYLITSYMDESLSVYQPDSPKLFSKIDKTDNSRWLWHNVPYTDPTAPTTIVVTLPVAPSVNQQAVMPAIELHRYDEGAKTLVQTQPTTGATVYTFTLNNGPAGSATAGTIDYYAIKIPNIVPAMLSGGIIVTTTEQCGQYCHLPVDQYYENALDIPTGRVLAKSLLWTDIASFFNKQGKIAGAALPKGTSWTSLLRNNLVNGGLLTNIQNLPEDEKDWEMEKGMYGWGRIVAPINTEFKRFVLADFKAQIITDIAYNPIQPDGQVIFMTCNTVPPGAPAAGPTGGFGATTSFTTIHIVEGRSSNKWREQAYAQPNASKAWEMAEDQVIEIPQFAENPLHLVEIWNAIKAAAHGLAKPAYKLLKQYGPAAAKALGNLYPVAKPYGDIAGSLIGVLPEIGM